MSTQNQLTQEQIDQLISLRYINRVDQHLKLVSSIRVLNETALPEDRVLLILDIFFDDQKIDVMSFNLHNYSYDEIIEIAKNIDSNEFIMRAVDTALAGDIE